MADVWTYRYRFKPGPNGVKVLHLKSAANQDLKVGQPLPYDVYNRLGMIVLTAGGCIKHSQQLEQLIDNGLYRVFQPEVNARQPVQESAAQRAFTMVGSITTAFANVLQHTQGRKTKALCVSQLQKLALDIQQLCLLDADAASAGLLLDDTVPVMISHSVYTAMLVALVCQRLEIDAASQQAMVCGALTHDIGLLDIHDVLDKQYSELSPEQRLRVDSHTDDGCRILRELGVDDQIWLNSVAQHHERIDGSGYPQGLARSTLKIPARLLALADCFSAIIQPKPYRKGLVSARLINNLLYQQPDKLDKRLVSLLFEQSGVYPAGAMVKLVNGELAVVIQQQDKIDMPLVYAFTRPDGEMRVEALLRDSNQEKYRIQGMINIQDYQSQIQLLRTLWTRKQVNTRPIVVSLRPQ